jgi:hypothetical protein
MTGRSPYKHVVRIRRRVYKIVIILLQMIRKNTPLKYLIALLYKGQNCCRYYLVGHSHLLRFVPSELPFKVHR